MRHRNRLKKLSRPADQRKAMLRSLATSLFIHGEIITTETRAKELIKFASRLITYGKKGDLASVRMAKRFLYHQYTGEMVEVAEGKELPETALHRLFHVIAPRYQERAGGYIRRLRAPARRGDNADMAIVQLV